MDAKDRRTRIEERVVATGEVRFAALAIEFDVSEMTIRRDIDVLRDAGIVRRVSGGAIALGGTAFEPSYGLRAGLAVDSKAHIAERVADLLTPGETVALDGGSTVAAVAHAVRGRGLNLTVVTPSLLVAGALADDEGTTIVLTGGRLRSGEMTLIGSDAEAAFARYNCDTFVIGVAGVDAERGLTEYHPQEASVKRAAVAASTRLIVGIDAAKLGRVHLVNIAPLSRVSTLVTDGEPENPTIRAAVDAGVETLLVPPVAQAREA